MISESIWLILELVALFFGVAFAVQLIQRRVGHERLRAWMGGRPVVSAIKGIAVGFVTPFCTYSAIPMLVGLRQAGVPVAGYVAFISAAPVLDPVLFGALAVIIGFEAALIYSAVAFTAALTLALLAQRVGIERHLKDPSLETTVPVASVPTGGTPVAVVQAGRQESTHDVASCAEVETTSWRGLPSEAVDASAAALRLLRSVAPLLLVGVTVGLLIESVVSPDQVAAITGSNATWSIPVAAGLGTPLYFSTSLFVPIANSLTNAGVGVGAIVALTISGAGANVPEFILLSTLASRRLIALFFGYVFAVALVGGVLAQLLVG